MQLSKLKPAFDQLQKIYGDPSLSSIYGAGCLHNPEICFVFMNPTGRNVAANPDWSGLRAPWIGTKNIWKLFSAIQLFSPKLQKTIQSMKADQWNTDFAARVYQEVTDQKLYITNLAKSTMSDARHLPDTIFQEYLPLLLQEIETIQPKKIISFGNQVSSIILKTPIKVSQVRTKEFALQINKNSFSIFPTYYPVGQGMRNMKKAIEDLRWIIKTTI